MKCLSPQEFTSFGNPWAEGRAGESQQYRDGECPPPFPADIYRLICLHLHVLHGTLMAHGETRGRFLSMTYLPSSLVFFSLR